MSCLRSITIRRNGDLFQVPCGKCPPCAYNKLAGWTFRLKQEDRVSFTSSFITLTYASDNLVSTPFGKMSICKYDLQLFFKRLRQRHARNSMCNQHPIRYYAVGEYGTKSARPHYHAIMFNAEAEHVIDAWQQGDVYFGDVTDNSIAYTLKYLNKRSTVGRYYDDDRHPQFTVSSNGLGLSYLTPSIRFYHHADLHNRKFLQLEKGACAMPRYYVEKLYDGYQRDLLAMSGSLIEQDRFFTDFQSVPYETRLQNAAVFSQRADAAIERHNYNLNSKILLL